MNRPARWIGIAVFAVALFAVAAFPQTQHSVKIGWNVYIQGSDTAVGFNVYRATVSGGPYTKLTSSSLPISATAYTDTTGAGGTKYFYVVTAVDAAGVESAFSAEASATFLAPPLAPQGVTAISQ